MHDTFTRLSKTYALKLKLDAAGVDAMSAIDSILLSGVRFS